MERVTVPERTLGPPPHARRMHRFDSAARSHPGAVRTNNEDAVFAGHNLVAVADGVGGKACGEVASEVAVEAIAYLEDRIYPNDPVADVREALRYANERIAQAVAADPARRGMATTLTALRLDGSALVVAHIGDSRAYRLRAGEWTRLTRDDSFVQALVDAGALTVEQAARHPARSAVTQALDAGVSSPHVSVQDLAAGDRYLVCSDGLSDYVDDAEIVALVGRVTDPDECCAALVDAALAAGAPDNVSCVVADVRPLEP